RVDLVPQPDRRGDRRRDEPPRVRDLGRLGLRFGPHGTVAARDGDGPDAGPGARNGPDLDGPLHDRGCRAPPRDGPAADRREAEGARLMDIQNVGFLAKTLTLASPTPEDLMKAYQTLSGRGSVTITCAPGEIGPVLLAAENAGFFGMRVEGDSITAHKGKEGPCYDTGRTAR